MSPLKRTRSAPAANAVLGSGFDSQAEVARVEQAAAADVVDQHDACVVGDGSEFCQGRLLGEADDAEIGGVNAEDGGGVLGDGVGVVGGSGAVGGADFDERGPGVAEDVGDAEAAADLDGLSAGDDHFTSRRVGGAVSGHGEVEGGGVVVDGDAGLSAGQGLERRLEVVGAGASGAGVEVVLEVGVSAGCIRHGDGGGFRDRGASEVGVDDDSGGVDDAAQGRSKLLAQGVSGRLGDVGGREGRVGAVAEQGAGDLNLGAHGIDHLRSGPAIECVGQGRFGEHSIDAGQRAQFA